LANEDVVRQNSFSGEQIDVTSHRQWLTKVLDDPGRLLLVVKNGNRFGGQVRFDGLNADEAEISMALAKTLRGRSLAAPVIRKALTKIPATSRIKRVVARIKRDNAASRRSFEAAGFVLCDDDPEKNFITMEYR
jgi:RimJ/RimL family protein N-acetyltransferase